MRFVSDLEIHAVHSCNLACDGCSHYSDQGQRGIVDLATADAWMRPWGKRLKPKYFCILGGEPTIHPQLPEFIRLSRRHFGYSHLALVTNGFFLHRHGGLAAALRETRCKLIVSIHGEGDRWRTHVAELENLLREGYQGVQVEWRPFGRTWIRHYRGAGPEMLPFNDGNPNESWRVCPAKHCAQLFDGCIWKCPQLAYLHTMPFQLRPEWNPYLAYEPLRPDCSDAELNEFFTYAPEAVCGMCPAHPEHYLIGDPMP